GGAVTVIGDELEMNRRCDRNTGGNKHERAAGKQCRVERRESALALSRAFKTLTKACLVLPFSQSFANVDHRNACGQGLDRRQFSPQNSIDENQTALPGFVIHERSKPVTARLPVSERRRELQLRNRGDARVF